VTATVPDAACAAPGRPRSEKADRDIAAATLALLAEHGCGGVTVEAVAARAGVARSTVYRRFPSREELLVGVVRHEQSVPKGDVDTGSVERDLGLVAHRLAVALTETPFGRALPAILGATAARPELSEVRAEFLATRRAPAVAAVRRGIDRGELAAGTDPEQVVDLVSGPVFYRVLVRCEPVDPSWIDAHVASVLRAFAP
jgi:AcrR family transcriptional regulator